MSLQQYCSAVNRRPQPLGKSCPAPSMFLWFPESAYRCPGASPGDIHVVDPKPQCCFCRAWLLWILKTLDEVFETPHWVQANRKAAKGAVFLFIFHLLWALCHACSQAVQSLYLGRSLHFAYCPVSQDKPQVRAGGAEQMQDDTLGLRIAAASHPKVLSYFVSHNSLFP